MQTQNFTDFTDPQSYIAQVEAWRNLYSSLSNWQRLRKFEIKRTQRSQEPAQSLPDVADTLRERHGAIACAAIGVKAKARTLLNTRAEMKARARDLFN